jgi:hypothetical protein
MTVCGSAANVVIGPIALPENHYRPFEQKKTKETKSGKGVQPAYPRSGTNEGDLNGAAKSSVFFSSSFPLLPSVRSSEPHFGETSCKEE